MLEKDIAEQFQHGFDCSQVVLSQFAEKEGVDPETAHRLSAAFGGGFMKGETCGAVVGALMALGLKYGHSQPDDFAQKELLREKQEKFLKKFYEEYPSTRCKELLELDFSKPEEYQEIMESGILFEFCPRLVADVIDIVEEV